MKAASVLRRAARFARSQIPVTADSGFSGAVGNTPLIRLNRLSDETGCNIYGKAEYMNPGASVKDRPALWIVDDAEKKGLLKPGGTIVEGTAGNTGVGLALISRSRGYKCIFYMPNTFSQRKIDVLRLLGAEVYPVPPAPISDPMNFNNQAQRHAERLENALWTNQFGNLANRQAHIETTGPEIWAQTNGDIDAFVCATGTGGSLSGITHYLKKISDGRVKAFLADPPSSSLYSYVTKRTLDPTGEKTFVEGVGQGRLTDNLAQDVEQLDGALYIEDEKTINMVYRLLDEEGLYLGGSSCLNVVAAYEVAKKLGPGNTVVTLLCDPAERYAYRFFSRKWLEETGLIAQIPEHLHRYIVLE